MNVKDIISSGLLELYITGLTSDEETVKVEQWAEQYPEVKHEIDELQRVMEEYAMAEAIEPDGAVKDKILAHIKPDDSVKEKIFAEIKKTPPPELTVIKNSKHENGAYKYKIPAYFKVAAAACICLLIGSLILNYSFYDKYKKAAAEAEKQQQLAQTMKSDMNVVTDKNAMPVVLNGTPHAPDALAKIFWMKNNGDVYVDPTNLPKAPAGKQYQLWAIVNGKPVDAGMITTTAKGTYHIQKMKSFGKAEAFAITLEKAGGSPTPTMDQMVVQAKVSI